MKYVKAKKMVKTLIFSLLFFFVPLTLQAQDEPQEKPRTDNPPTQQDKPQTENPTQTDQPIQQDKQKQKDKQTQTMQKTNEKYSQTAQELSKGLASDLKLNEAQTTQVQNILVDYQANVLDSKKDMNESVASVNKSIESLLQDEQKTSWTRTKEDFWKRVHARVETSPKKMEEDIN